MLVCLVSSRLVSSPSGGTYTHAHGVLTGVEHYADRFLGGKGRGKNSSLAKLQDPEEAQRLNKAFFPASVWEPFFERKSVKSKSGSCLFSLFLPRNTKADISIR